LSSYHQFIQGETSTSSSDTGAGFAESISALQYLNKPTSAVRAEKNYLAAIHTLQSFIKENSSALTELLISNLGFSQISAHTELIAAQTVLQNLESESTFDPQIRFARGLVAIRLTWSSPIQRFFMQVVPALICQNSVLLFCDKEVSKIYVQLSEWVFSTELGRNRIAVVSTSEKDTLDLLCDHPSVKALHVEDHLYSSSQFRHRILLPEKHYRFFFGAHNPVIILNDANLNLLTDTLYQSLQYHSWSEVRFNRWFVQEKIFPDFIDWLNKALTFFPENHFGRMVVEKYKQEYLQQHSEFSRTKHWIHPYSLDPQTLNVNTDFSNCSSYHQKELLGPLLTITRFKNGPEVSKFANTTFFSNCTSIFTESIEKFKDLALLQRTSNVVHNALPQMQSAAMRRGELLCGMGSEVSNFDFYSTKKFKAL
jgi:acyl-CoA reductase-like NAD-dependent aldehyde dehydrogenase